MDGLHTVAARPEFDLLRGIILMLSVNELAVAIVDRLVSAADDLQISVSDLENGSRIIDAGIAVSGSAEAGRLIAEICLGGWAG